MDLFYSPACNSNLLPDKIGISQSTLALVRIMPDIFLAKTFGKYRMEQMTQAMMFGKLSD